MYPETTSKRRLGMQSNASNIDTRSLGMSGLSVVENRESPLCPTISRRPVSILLHLPVYRKLTPLKHTPVKRLRRRAAQPRRRRDIRTQGQGRPSLHLNRVLRSALRGKPEVGARSLYESRQIESSA